MGQKVVNQLPASMSTQNDRNVLNSILNPNLPLGEGVFDPDQQAPESLTEAGYNDDNVKQLEKDGVRSAEEGNLNKAMELSKGEGRAASSALCQRGILHRREGRDDDALKDFKAAASEGSGFGKTMLVEMNPYAAMCNAMLRNVFTAMANGDDSEKLMSQNMKTKSG